MTTPTALITGHKGFVGRHIGRALKDLGWDTIGVDTFRSGSIGLQKEYGADIRDYFSETAGDPSPDVVVHCAAVSPYRAAIDNNAAWVGAESLSIDAALFSWMQRTPPLHAPHVVYLSSSAAYPVSLQGPYLPKSLQEDDINLSAVRQPDAIYGWTKLTGERLAALVNAAGHKVSVVRPFSGYGTDQATHFPFGAFLARARFRADPFKILGPGDQVRDWVHIDDIVHVIVRILDTGITGPLNIGTGQGTDIDSLASLICGEAGYSPEYIHILKATSGVHSRVADIERMRELYEEPLVSLEEGIRRAFA